MMSASRMSPRSKTWILLLIIALPFAASLCPASDSGKVRILFLGEVAPSNQLFLDWIEAEPRFTMTTVPCDMEWISLKEAKRFARIYLPRTEDRLIAEFDVAIFEDFGPDVLPMTILDWIQEAVSKGMGIALIEYAYWGGTNEIRRWMDLRFYDVFPANVQMNIIQAGAGRTFYEVTNENGPLNLPGLESVPINQGYHGDLSPRQGSTVEAVWRGRQEPAMVTSAYGRGHTLQLDHGWDNIPGETRVKYEYLPEYIYNQVFFIAAIPYPKDLNLVRITRASFVAYNDRKKATLAVLEFVERFGANPDKVSTMLESMDSRYSQASQMYFAGDYEQAGDVLLQLLEEFSELDADLMEAKDGAFLWIYVIEWATVAGVSVLCGVFLWTLMIRRRLYRVVGITRPQD